MRCAGARVASACDGAALATDGAMVGGNDGGNDGFATAMLAPPVASRGNAGRRSARTPDDETSAAPSDPRLFHTNAPQPLLRRTLARRIRFSTSAGVQAHV